MSYDPPTRRIPPEQVPPRPPVAGQPYEVDPLLEERQELRDRIKTLQTALALVGLLALIGLGLALYGVLSPDEEERGRDRTGASPARVENLRERVNELENRIDDRATKNSVQELAAQQEELESSVEQLGEQAQDDGGADDAAQAVEDVQSDVQSLEQRIEELESNQGAGGAP